MVVPSVHSSSAGSCLFTVVAQVVGRNPMVCLGRHRLPRLPCWEIRDLGSIHLFDGRRGVRLTGKGEKIG